MVECLGCHSADVAETGVTVEETYPLLRCRRCGLGFLRLPLEEREPFDDYWGDVNETIYSTPEVVGELNRKYARFLGMVLPQAPNRRMLDVGSGIGLCIEQAARMGFEPVGVEPSPRAREIAGRQRDVRIETALLTREDDLPRDNGVLTLWDVIEHVPDPEYLMNACADHLADGGVLVLETPDESAPARAIAWALYRMSGRRLPTLRYIYYRAHRQYFTRDAMRALLGRCGFEDVRIHREFTMFAKAVAKLRMYHGASAAKARLYGVAFATMKRVPFLANKMVVVARRRLRGANEAADDAAAARAVPVAGTAGR